MSYLNNLELNIIGRGAGWEDGLLSPGDKWCVNVYRDGCDVMFQMHDETAVAQVPDLAAEMQKATQAGATLYTLENYPVNEMIEYFKTRFFSHSVCYMLALGMYQGYQKITLWGCNMRSETMSIQSHPGTEFWLGYAMGRGVEISIQGDSYLLRIKTGELYGYNVNQF